MSKAPLMAAIVGMAAGLAGVGLAIGARGAADEAQVRADQAMTSAQKASARAEQLEAQLGKAQRALRTAENTRAGLREDLTALGARLDAASTGLAAAPGADGSAATAARDADVAARKQARVAEMRELQKKVFSGKATEEEQRKFWGLARDSGVVDELITALEKTVADNPYDNDQRMNLAQGYVAKLLSIPGGPEQGIWAMKAEGQWKKVLADQPDHWDAGYSLAFSWSQYPEFLNKTPDSIKQFEKVREVQERATPEGKHANTYVQLAILYRRQGNDKQAREALTVGKERHPDDAGIQKALASMGTEE